MRQMLLQMWKLKSTSMLFTWRLRATRCTRGLRWSFDNLVSPNCQDGTANWRSSPIIRRTNAKKRADGAAHRRLAGSIIM